MDKRGISNLIAIAVIVLMCVIMISAIYINLKGVLQSSKGDIEQKVYAISNIHLSIISVDFFGNNLKITLENKGSQDISSFIVRITSSRDEVYLNNSVYLAEKQKLTPLETKFIIVIPAPFGVIPGNYSLVEVYPRFEFNEKEEIAETGKASFSIPGVGVGSRNNNPAVAECSDGIDDDNDGYVDLDDAGCSDINDNNESDISGCRIDFLGMNGNLVQNPNLECDNDKNNLPDNWKKDSESANHKLYWAEDTTNHGTKIISSDFSGTGNGDENSFAWISSIPSIKPDTWYEFSFDYTTEGVEPNINLSDNTIKSSTNWMGVAVNFYNSTIKSSSNLIRSADNFACAYGPSMAGWDESAGVYRTYEKKGLENWRRVKKYIKSPSRAVYAEIKTYNYPRGKIYSDNFVLKEIGASDPITPEFKKSGKLEFIQLKRKDYFPIILYGIPTQNSQVISLDSIKERGFNSVRINYWYQDLGYEKLKELLLEKDISAVIELPSFYYNNQKSVWVNDPSRKLVYSGWNTTKSYIANWAGFENLLGFNGPDEKDCAIEVKGWYIPNLKSFELLKNYKDAKAPEAYLITNYCGFVTSTAPYTGNPDDLINYYIKNDDVLSQTINTPKAYPVGNEDPYMNNVGKATRRLIDYSIKQGKNKPVLSYGLGVNDWANWDGKDNGRYLKKYVPFNIQRYQVWEQIINGAVGVWFWGTYHTKLEDSYYQHHWNQISAISKELASLYPVLLEPDYYDGWQVSDARIDIMMKKHAGRIYLFTASTAYTDLQNVMITLHGYTIKNITAINEVSNGDINNVFNRTLAISSDKHSFTDNFLGEYDSSKSITAPGYAVHIYEIEYV